MSAAPVRLCCGERHWDALCPDGKVMCCLCFERFETKDLNPRGNWYEDVCVNCAAHDSAAPPAGPIQP